MEDDKKPQPWIESIPSWSEVRRNIFWSGLTIFAVFVLLDATRWFSGGGIFSVLWSMILIASGAERVEIDPMCLELPISAIPIFLNAGLLVHFEINVVTKRDVALLFGPGFVASMVLIFTLSGHLVSMAMSSTWGYHHCSYYDRSTGRGKDGIWLSGYVSSGTSCPR